MKDEIQLDQNSETFSEDLFRGRIIDPDSMDVFPLACERTFTIE